MVHFRQDLVTWAASSVDELCDGGGWASHVGVSVVLGRV